MKSDGNRTSARLRSWIRDGAIILGVTLAAVVGLEVVLRSFFPQHIEGTPVKPGHFSEKDDVLGSRYIPLAHWRFRHPEYTVEYAINEHGFRDKRDHPLPKPAGRTRALLLGDSFTFGQGVNYDDVWTVIAERKLDSLGRSGLELVKVGLQGADQRSQLIMLDRLLGPTESDAVIVVFLINDLYTNLPLEPTHSGRLAFASGGEMSQSEALGSLSADTAWKEMREQIYTRGGFLSNLHTLTLARRVVTSFDAGYNMLYVAAQSRGGYLRLPLAEEPQRKLEITEQLFRQIAEYCREHGRELIVMSIPQQFQVLYRKPVDAEGIDVSFYDRHFSEFATQNGFTWIPFLDDFMEDPDPSRYFFRLDGHLTPAGNQLVADAFLRKVVPLIDSDSAAQ